MSPEEIRDYAVKAVSGFCNHQIPLAKGVADIANEQRLNPEQIKRVVEAANSVAYLNLLQKSKDRTFEFTVASYPEVVKHMTGLADSQLEEGREGPAEGSSNNSVVTPPVVKEASLSELFTEQERIAMLKQAAYKTYDALPDLYIELDIKVAGIEKLASELREDPYFMDKLKKLSEEFEKSAAVVTMAKRFYEKQELEKVATFLKAVEEARTLEKGIAEKEEFVKRAFTLLEHPYTKPLKPLGAGEGMVTKAKVSDKVGKVARMAGSAVVGAPMYALGTVGGAIAGGIGRVGLETAKITTKPFRQLVKGKSLGQRLGKGLTVGADVLAGTAVTHKHDVWSSIHG